LVDWWYGDLNFVLFSWLIYFSHCDAFCFHASNFPISLGMFLNCSASVRVFMLFNIFA
jgi:hypothetical protein